MQISALTKALKINIEIAYLDGHSADGTVNFVPFQNLPEVDVQNPPILLYRSVSKILSLKEHINLPIVTDPDITTS